MFFIFAAAFLWSGSARADYWTRHKRADSGNVLPEYFELENMAKSAGGLKFLYGTDRIGGVGQEAEQSHVRHLITFDGTNWTDQTDTVKSVNGTTDICFSSITATRDGNIWMPNTRDGDRALIKYNTGSETFEKITSAQIAQQAFPGGYPTSLKIHGTFEDATNNRLYAYAEGDDRLYLVYLNLATDEWADSGISGGPLTSANSGKDVWGMHNSVDGSIWAYEYHSSEYQYSNPAGGDQGIGVWQHVNGSWHQYDSSDISADGVSLRNGVTEAFSDSDGNIWVGTRYGVFKHDYSDGNWYNWTKDNSNIFTNRVIKTQEDSDGRVWIIALEDENVEDDNGGISIYNNDTGEWDYYSSYNGEDALDDATNIFMIGGDEAWMFTGHGEVAMAAGIYQLVRDDSHTALYGQVAGTTVEKASMGQLKKSRTKKFKIWKHTRVKRKWKRKKTLYRGRATDNWYKALNLTVSGNIRYTVKITGKKKQRITPTSGEPVRLDFN